MKKEGWYFAASISFDFVRTGCRWTLRGQAVRAEQGRITRDFGEAGNPRGAPGNRRRTQAKQDA